MRAETHKLEPALRARASHFLNGVPGAGGDLFAASFFEMGSIVVSFATAWMYRGFDVTRWRSDDVVKLARTLVHDNVGAADVLGIMAGLLIGGSLAFILTRWELGSRGASERWSTLAPLADKRCSTEHHQGPKSPDSPFARAFLRAPATAPPVP